MVYNPSTEAGRKLPEPEPILKTNKKQQAQTEKPIQDSESRSKNFKSLKNSLSPQWLHSTLTRSILLPV